MLRGRIALETGTHSPWISRLLTNAGTPSHRGACPQGAFDRGEAEEKRSHGRTDAGAGTDRSSVAVSGETSQRQSAGGPDTDPGPSRLVRARTALVNTAHGLAKSYGERLRGCNVRNLYPEKPKG